MADVNWNTEDREAVLIHPLPKPDRAGLESIPMGAHVLIAVFDAEGVSFEGGTWNEADLDNYLTYLHRTEKDHVEDVSIFYVVPPPTFEGELPSADEVIKSAMVEHIGGGPEAFVEPPEELAVVLRLIVQKAREGMVVNPF